MSTHRLSESHAESQCTPPSTDVTRAALSTPEASSASRGSCSAPPVSASTALRTPSTPILTSKLVRQKIDSSEFVIAPKENGTAACWKTFGIVRRKPSPHDADGPMLGDIVAGFAACRSCKKVYAYDSHKTGTNNMDKHALGHTTASKKTGEQPGIFEAMTAASAPTGVTKEAKSKITRSSAHFVCRDLRPYSAVEGEGLAVFATDLVTFGQRNPKAKINVKVVKELLPCRNTVKRHVGLIGKDAKVALGNVLNKAVASRTAAFTTDQWTDDNRKRTYTDITCYIIDDQFELSQYTVACHGFPSGETKSGQNILAEMVGILGEYNVNIESAKKCFFTTDYGSSIISGLNLFYGSKDFPVNLRQGCLAHRINTVLRTAWSNTASDIEVAKNFDTNVGLLVQFSKQSGLQAKLENTLKKRSPTRWNSLYLTLATIKDGYADIENHLRGSKDLRRLTCIDRVLLDQVTSFLEHFKYMTDMIEAEREPTLQTVVLAFYQICSLCEPDSEDDPVLAQFKEYILQFLVEKVTLESYHWNAVFLDPKFKDLLMFDNDEDRTAKRLEIENDLKAAIGDDAQVENIAEAENDVLPVDVPSPSKRKRDCFSKFKAASKALNKPKTLSVSQEIQVYESMEYNSEKKLLSFWYEQRAKLPLLSRIARQLYVIPATSASSERCFSAAGRVLEKRRTRLVPSSVDTMLRARSALKTSLILH